MSIKKKPRSSLTKPEKMEVIEGLMAMGITNQYDIARKVGLTQPEIVQYMKMIRKENVIEGYSTLKEKRHVRLKQLEYLQQLALTKFKESCTEKIEITTTSVKCSFCLSTGLIKIEGGGEEECVICEGKGTVDEVKTKITQMTGDSSYVRIATDCVKESAKIEGTYLNANRATATVKRMLKESKMVGGELQEKVEEIYLEAPIDLVLKAKASIEELKMKVEEAKAIDVKSVKITST